VGFGVVAFVHHILALTPLIAFGVIYVFSWYVEATLGYWPRPTFDDPKLVATGAFSGALYTAIWLLMLGSCFAALAFPILSAALWSKYPKLWSLLLIAAFLLGWVILRLDPGSRVMWFID
jgi:hypothetical protein